MKFDLLSRSFALFGLLGALAAPGPASAQVAEVPLVASCPMPMPIVDSPAPAGRRLLEHFGVSLPASGTFELQPNIGELHLLAGQRYVIETHGLSSGADTIIELRRARTPGSMSQSDTVVAENDDRSPGNLASAIEWTADQSGTYYVHIRSYEGSGGGTFDLRVTEANADVGPPPVATHPVVAQATGATVLSERSLSFEGAAGFEALPNIELSRLAAGRRYAIETFELSEDADTIVELRRLGSSGAPSATDEIVAANDDAPGTYASRVEWSADQNGPYYVHVRPYGASSGTFSLRVVEVR